jgi:prevent-host-death family protein
MAIKQSPKTETMSVSETRKTFSETLNRVYRGETRVLVEKSGIPVGAIVSPGELETLARAEEESRKALLALADIQSAFQDVPEDELERELAKAIAEVKEIRRHEREHAAKQPA